MTDYDRIAERCAAGVATRRWNALCEQPATLALLPPVSGLDVLDAGCGHGWYAIGCRLTALVSSGMTTVKG